MPVAVNPFPYFPEAATGGYIYIGAANQDAQANPVTVYRDAALTVAWEQPIRTLDGYPAYQGAAEGIFLANPSYSIKVQDSNQLTLVNELLASDPVAQISADLASVASGKGSDLVANVQRVWDVTRYGAVGNGTADDTAGIVAAIAAATSGGVILFRTGRTFMTDYITINKKVHILIEEGAVLKQRIPANPATTLDAHWGIFKFVAGSEGSVVEGGTMDGNRAALAPYYIGHTRLGQDNHWWGIRTEYVDDITIRNMKFRNFFSEAFYAFNGQRFKALDVDIADCGVAFQAQGSNEYAEGWIIRATCRNIGNVIAGTAYYIFQHGLTIGLLKNSTFDVSMEGYCASGLGTDGVSTGGGKEPVPIAMNIYLLEGCTVKTLVRDYTTIPAFRSIHQAYNFASVNNSTCQMLSYGFEQALAMGSSCNNTLDVSFDGDYVNVAGYPREGLLLTIGGVSPPNAATLAGEATSNLSSRDNVIRGTVKSFGIGVRDESEGNDLGGLSVYGNVTDGVQLVVAAGGASSYPTPRRRASGGRDLVGIQVTANGNAGVIYTGGNGDRIMSGFIRDNGQTFGSPVQPYNVAVVADAGEGVALQIADNDIDVTPAITLVNEVSYVPGTAVAKSALRTYSNGVALTHTYQVIMRNVNQYRVGEIIRLKGVLSGGLDADGKVVDIDQDVVTLAFAAALVFSDSGTLDTLTGTGTTAGINLTGVGTSFLTQIDFPAYLKSGSEYRRIVYVTSNTSAVIDSPFTTNLSGAALQVVRADVETGIVKAVSGLNVNGNVTVGPMLIRDNVAYNVDNFINAASFPGIAAGSRFDVTYSLAMTGTGLSNTLVTGLPAWTQVSAVKLLNVTAVTGVSGSVNVTVNNSGGTVIATPVTGATLTLAAVNRGAIPECPAFQAVGGSIRFVSSAGNPTGTVRVQTTMNKLVW